MGRIVTGSVRGRRVGVSAVLGAAPTHTLVATQKGRAVRAALVALKPVEGPLPYVALEIELAPSTGAEESGSDRRHVGLAYAKIARVGWVQAVDDRVVVDRVGVGRSPGLRAVLSPPVPASSHSASLGKNPPSQMQNA